MKTNDEKIASSIQQHPDYDRLDGLSQDVWHSISNIRANESAAGWFNLTLTPAIKACSLVLLLASCLALSQISFEQGAEPDLFDLRYFSHQSLATTNMLSLNVQGLRP